MRDRDAYSTWLTWLGVCRTGRFQPQASQDSGFEHNGLIQFAASVGAVKDVAGYNVIASRVVGFLFHALWNMQHCLGDTPVNRLTTEVVSAMDRNEIYALGRSYIDHLICSCTSKLRRSMFWRLTDVVATVRKPTPPPSNHPSRPSMDQIEDLLIDAIDNSPEGRRSTRTRVRTPETLFHPF